MNPATKLPTWPNQIDVRENEPLAKHTTFAVGGPADYFAMAESTTDLVALLDASVDAGLPATVIGEGSNILVGDDGIRGLVIQNRSTDIEFLSECRLRAGSGTLMGHLARQCADRGLAGLEFGVGIPGTIGGSIFGNAGCFGSEIKDVLVEAQVWNNGVLQIFGNEDLNFTYRTSVLQTMPGNPIALEALVQGFTADSQGIRQRMTSLSRRRRETQPAERSAGSIFRNPTPRYAGRLVDDAGLKGVTNGDAHISELHANYIVNRGNATAAEIAALIQRARTMVAARSGVVLETEIRFLGEGFGEIK